MPSFIRTTYKIVMEEFSSWRPCLGCFHSSRRSSPTADIKDRNLRKRLQKFCRISTLKSSNAPIGSADLWSCPNAGSSSAPSHGSIAADGSPRIGRTSTERRSRSCASHQSASCSENSAIRPELSGQTLRFVIEYHPQRVALLIAVRVDHNIVASYVERLRRTRLDSSIATELHHVRLALKLMCESTDWSWLQTVTKRIAAQARRKTERHHEVTSERLYALGFELMNAAMEGIDRVATVSKQIAFQYRDGLLISVLAAVPLRRSTLAALRIGTHLVKTGKVWALDIPAGDTKTRQALEFPLSAALSGRIDIYLNQFRTHIPGANTHDGLWASNKAQAMDDDAIYSMVCRRTRE